MVGVTVGNVVVGRVVLGVVVFGVVVGLGVVGVELVEQGQNLKLLISPTALHVPTPPP